tara:strand:+ start:334 stop:585 length:252 start_codon:yes stop_codon:yes gene_type:complete
MKDKDVFIKFLYERGYIINNDNVYHAERAFKINALVDWCMKQQDQEIIRKSLLLVERFLAGDIDIKIKDDTLKVYKRKRSERN